MRMIVRFGKNARLRFISHLDIQRFLHMALGRCTLPVRYTEGFNPHPQMAFGSALALYWTSDYEIVDVRLTAPMGRKKCEDAMRAALPCDLPVYEVRLVDDRVPAMMAQVAASDYEITLDGEASGTVIAAIPDFLARERVIAVRRTKSGEREADIRPLAIALAAEGSVIRARLSLTDADTLKPDLLVKVLAEMAGVEAPETHIHRACLLGRNSDGELRPLMEIL